MRKLALLLLLSGIPWPALAANRVTVEQLEQLLVEAHGKRDAKVAEQFSGLELTERASSSNLSRWEAGLPGRHAREALVLLADKSAFLDPPAAEIPALAPPNLIAQQLMFSRTVKYLIKTIPRLPNFFATRFTTRYEDALVPSRFYAGFDYQPLQTVASSSDTVIYRDGHETVDAGTLKGERSKRRAPRLTTVGEFGPILSTVIGDAVQGEITWDHWELGAAGPQAVFHYVVPQSKSHYQVSFPYNEQTEELSPAYHGEIAVDPANGDVLRLTMVAELEPAYRLVQSDIVVEYGPVAIGGSTYICPVKAVAFSKVPIPDDIERLHISPVLVWTYLNDVLFKQYHVFRAQSRMLTGDTRILRGP